MSACRAAGRHISTLRRFLCSHIRSTVDFLLTMSPSRSVLAIVENRLQPMRVLHLIKVRPSCTDSVSLLLSEVCNRASRPFPNSATTSHCHRAALMRSRTKSKTRSSRDSRRLDQMPPVLAPVQNCWLMTSVSFRCDPTPTHFLRLGYPRTTHAAARLQLVNLIRVQCPEE